MLLNQVTTLHIDLPVATFFTVGLYFALLYYKTRSPLDFSLFLASMGVLAGIKTPGIIYAGFLVSLLAGLELCRAAKTPSLPKALRATVSRWRHPLIGLGFLALLFLGGFWYVRNALEAAVYSDPFDSSAGGGASSQMELGQLWSKTPCYSALRSLRSLT